MDTTVCLWPTIKICWGCWDKTMHAGLLGWFMGHAQWHLVIYSIQYQVSGAVAKITRAMSKPLAVLSLCKLWAIVPTHQSTNLWIPVGIWLVMFTTPLTVKEVTLITKVGLTQPTDNPKDQSWELLHEFWTSIFYFKVWSLVQLSGDSRVVCLHILCMLSPRD